eukprot:g22168.t1
MKRCKCRIGASGLLSLFNPQGKVLSCDRCCELFKEDGELQLPDPGQDHTKQHIDEEKEILKKQLREMELELAQTKLQLVEAKCKIQ